MYEVPEIVRDATWRNIDSVDAEIARRAVAHELQKQIDELTALKDGSSWTGDGVAMVLARTGLQAAIDHLRIRLAEVATA